MNAPVLVVGFNRPDHLRAVLDVLVDEPSRRVYVALDGPRPDRPHEIQLCAQALSVAESYRGRLQMVIRAHEANQGCARGVKSAIDWFFDKEIAGIVLEDDCLPHPQFFPFCQYLLDRYRDDQRVWMITGNNLLTEFGAAQGDYFFSDGGVWGWASWRDRWSHMQLCPTMDRASRLAARRFLGRREWRRIEPRVRAAAAGRIDTWDYQWLFTRVSRGGLAVVPTGNLVSNVGFGVDATHTTTPTPASRLPFVPVHLPPSSTAPLRPNREYIRRKARLEEPSLRERLLAKVHWS